MTDSQYSFRISIEMAPSDRIGSDQWRVERIFPGIPVPILLSSGHPEKAMKDSGQLVVRADGFDEESTAQDSGARVLQSLKVALARLAMGADFGGIRPSSHFYPYGVALISGKSGSRILNNERGLMTFSTEPSPRFVTGGSARAIRGMQIDRFLRVLDAASSHSSLPDDRTNLAFELYNASFFETGVQSRFLLLVMATEALIAPRKRPAESCEHLARLVIATNENPALIDADRESLAGAIAALQSFSIGHLGRELVAARLGNRQYANLSPSDFFTKCYRMRGTLVHAGGGIAKAQIIAMEGPLETFVGQLLSYQILDVDA